MAFFAQYKWVILFYSAIILLVFLNRKKFDMHGLIALYRTKIGLKTMDSWSKKYHEFLKLLGYIGIGAGYVGLIVISVVIFKNLITLFTVADAAPAVSPVLPGIKVPGTEFTLPLISGWLALFVVVLVHEFSHGVIARVHNLKVKSSGLFFLGPLMGAFVEPDEKQMQKQDDVVQYSVLAAGPFSNMLTAAVILLIASMVIPFVHGVMVNEQGFLLTGVTEDYPAAEAGLEAGMIITKVNDAEIKNTEEFTSELNLIKGGEAVDITANETVYGVETIVNPNNNRTAYLGVLGSTNIVLKNPKLSWLYAGYEWLIGFFMLLVALSLGIGLINLFPIFITDGARMLRVSLVKIKGEEKGFRLWKNTNIICVFVILISLFFPLFKFLLGI